MSELKDKGAVTALAVAGLVFGVIGLLGSFIPCLGVFALYVSVPAGLVSAVAIAIAIQGNAKRSLAIAALVISVIAAGISLFQKKQIESIPGRIDEASRSIDRRLPARWQQQR